MIFSSVFGDIYYEVHGPEDAPVLVFTHGIVMDHRTFSRQTAAFSDSYRVVLWDMPGHGKSFSASREFSFSMAAQCLIGLLDEIDAPTAVLIGVSLGGHISQYAASHYPGRITAVAVIGSIPLHKKFNIFIRSMLSLTMKASISLLGILPQKSFAAYNSRGKAIAPDTLEYLESLTIQAGKKHTARLHEALVRGIFEAISSPIQQPLLIAHGDKEIALNKKMARKWHESNPDSTYAVIPDAGHVANQDNPEACNRLLLQFLQQQNASSDTPLIISMGTQ